MYVYMYVYIYVYMCIYICMCMFRNKTHQQKNNTLKIYTQVHITETNLTDTQKKNPNQNTYQHNHKQS